MIIKILLIKNKVLLNFHLHLFIIMKRLEFGLIILYGLVFVSSDYDKNTLTTKKMSINQLVQFILSNKIDELVKKNIESNLSDAILNTISANNEFVADVLDGVRDEQLIIGSTQGA